MCSIFLTMPLLVLLLIKISPITGMGLIDPNTRWPQNTVPYEIGEYNQNDINLIKQAMNVLQSKTCIRFVEHTNEKNYMKIREDDLYICASDVGMINMGMQELNLRAPGCMHLQTIIHELLHTLGLVHMHTSSDRDKFIDVDYTNIRPEKHYLFDKVDPAEYSYFGTAYDPASVMHYKTDDFAVDPSKRTIHGKTPEVSWKLDIKTLSDGDIARVNNMYNCQGYGSYSNS